MKIMARVVAPDGEEGHVAEVEQAGEADDDVETRRARTT